MTWSASGIGTLIINEFLAANGTGLADENGDQEDWIDILNPGASTVSLAGWSLTNDPGDPRQWTFPAWTLDAGKYLVLYASGKNRKPAQTTAGSNNTNTVASPRLQPNFKLSESGGYLGLFSPESPAVVVSQFPPNYQPSNQPEYPPQRTDYSYGLHTGGVVRYLSPPTPGAVNTTSTPYTVVTSLVNASVGRGFLRIHSSLCSRVQKRVRRFAIRQTLPSLRLRLEPFIAIRSRSAPRLVCARWRRSRER